MAHLPENVNQKLDNKTIKVVEEDEKYASEEIVEELDEPRTFGSRQIRRLNTLLGASVMTIVFADTSQSEKNKRDSLKTIAAAKR